MNKILIFTDGSARGNPGPGGYGVIIKWDSHEVELGGADPHTTNNKMELTAAVKALEFVLSKNISAPVTIFSDSEYVVKGMTEWIHNWKKKNWRTAGKKPVLNQELWSRLSDLAENFQIGWKYVAGHSGHRENDRCDEIATSFADGAPLKLKNL